MNWDQIAGDWKKFVGKAKERWGDLTDDELMVAAGRRDQIEGLLRERYGFEHERAERELSDFSRSLDI